MVWLIESRDIPFDEHGLIQKIMVDDSYRICGQKKFLENTPISFFLAGLL